MKGKLVGGFIVFVAKRGRMLFCFCLKIGVRYEGASIFGSVAGRMSVFLLDGMLVNTLNLDAL